MAGSMRSDSSAVSACTHIYLSSRPPGRTQPERCSCRRLSSSRHDRTSFPMSILDFRNRTTPMPLKAHRISGRLSHEGDVRSFHPMRGARAAAAHPVSRPSHPPGEALVIIVENLFLSAHDSPSKTRSGMARSRVHRSRGEGGKRCPALSRRNRMKADRRRPWPAVA